MWPVFINIKCLPKNDTFQSLNFWTQRGVAYPIEEDGQRKKEYCKSKQYLEHKIIEQIIQFAKSQVQHYYDTMSSRLWLEIFQLHLCEDYGSYSEATEAGDDVYSPPFECVCVLSAPFNFDLLFFYRKFVSTYYIIKPHVCSRAREVGSCTWPFTSYSAERLLVDNYTLHIVIVWTLYLKVVCSVDFKKQVLMISIALASDNIKMLDGWIRMNALKLCQMPLQKSNESHNLVQKKNWPDPDPDWPGVTEFWGPLHFGDPRPHIYGRYGDPSVVLGTPDCPAKICRCLHVSKSKAT